MAVIQKFCTFGQNADFTIHFWFDPYQNAQLTSTRGTIPKAEKVNFDTKQYKIDACEKTKMLNSIYKLQNSDYIMIHEN